MAIIKNGILGGFSGKVGTVVGYTLYDQDIIRGLGERKAPFTRRRVEKPDRIFDPTSLAATHHRVFTGWF